MFIVTKQVADDYRKSLARPAEPALTTTSTQTEQTAPQAVRPTTDPGVTGATSSVGATQTNAPSPKSQLHWSGVVPSQKWMNFYTKVLTKLGAANGLTLTVKVECSPEGGVSQQKLEEIKSALREVGLDDSIGLG